MPSLQEEKNNTMILSMTGFGRGVSSSPTKKYTVEIKSLNSKQLDLMMRVPPYLREIEVEARDILAPALERGKVECAVSVENNVAAAPATVNTGAIAAYKTQIEHMAAELGLPLPAGSEWYQILMRLPEAMKTEVSAAGEEDVSAVREAMKNAVDALVAFRVSEGRKLYGFFIEKLDNIARLLDAVAPYEAERVPRVRARLEENLSRLSSIEYEAGRLEQELIFYIEKLDVTEEKTRLTAHLRYFKETLGSENELPTQGQGKKLGFIAQEMGREINTLGSKSNHAEMQKIVVMMKDELEQIKEQVLNVL